MGKRNKNKNSEAPTHAVALYDYNPFNDDVHIPPEGEQCLPPDASVQLQLTRGERVEIISRTLDWWIICRSLKSGREGYLPTAVLAPICEPAVGDGFVDQQDGNVKMEKVKFLPCNNQRYFDLKFFPNAPESHTKKPCPHTKANIFSLITFWWINDLMVTGFKRPLIEEDMWELDDDNSINNIIKRCEVEWKKEIEAWQKSPLIPKKVQREKKQSNMEKQNHEGSATLLNNIRDETVNDLEHKYQPSLSKMFFRVFGSYYLFGNIFKILHDIITFVSPYLLAKLISFVKTKNEDIFWGYTYAVLLLVAVTFQSIFLHQYFQRIFVTCMRLKSSIMAMVYRKMLKLNSKGRQNYTAGEMVNMMQVDSQKCHDFVLFAVWFWSAPLQVTVSLIFLYSMMGWSVFIGFVVLLLILPISIILAKREKIYHAKQMTHKDTRSKLINEILNGIKILKLYAWEESFVEKIMGYRNKELSQLRMSMFLHGQVYAINNFAPILVSIVTFATYVYAANKELTAENAFVAIALFNIIRFPIVFLPRLVQIFVQYKISIKRLTDFLIAEELDESDVLRLEYIEKGVAVNISQSSFTWNVYEHVLKNINFEVPEGSLTAIVGQVGTGKSSLLSAILGEIHKVKGSVTTRGKIAYVSQQAWIQNKSLRENILFTKKFKWDKYNKIVNACALKADLDILPVGDMTEIGERGINLSGGQKQRVSLARAVYSNADIYLLDDPLSAVDAHVGKHIFDSVLGPNGLLMNKARILVTHNLSFLPQVDQIIVLKNNTISEIGTYKELLENGNDFSEFLRTYHKQNEKESLYDNEQLKLAKKENKQQAASELLEVPSVKIRGRTSSYDNSLLHELDPMLSTSSYSLFENVDACPHEEEIEIQEMLFQHEEYEKKKANAGGITYQDEKSETGTVNRKVFGHYFQAMGVITTLFIFSFGFVQEALLIATRFWLAEWSSQVNVTTSARDRYVAVYGGIGVAQSISLLIMCYAVVIGAIRASRYLHDWLLSTVLRCPMSFFETTPMGRVVNQFVKEMNIVDESIPRSFQSFITTFMGMLGTIFVISFLTPIFLVVLLPIAALYFFTQRFFVASSRQLKRIESVNRSPIYNHYLESIGGASTIRAFGRTGTFIAENEIRIDRNQASYFPAVTANRWLAIRLEFCGNLVTFFAALFAIINYENMTPGKAGLSISYALQITQSLNWLVRMTSELETNIISVERIKNYIDKPKEAPAEIPDNRPPENWPEHGAVTFESYSVRYRTGLDLVLRNIDCSIKPSEKIGIVGRTGAGKSSMVLALFRIIESACGKIIIDGVDIASIGLKDLRTKLSIIPQDPVLFSSSMRFNLDPFNEFSDDELWRALEVSHLKNFVSSIPGGIHYEVLEGGENLSVGQRQLICLARALLRNSKILILDEATAAVDMETDAYIQEAIRKEFSGSTVFTIAHRLNTIMDYDRIIVLDNGHIVEFNTPDVLLDDEGSIFHSMIKDAGLLGDNKEPTDKDKYA